MYDKLIYLHTWEITEFKANMLSDEIQVIRRTKNDGTVTHFFTWGPRKEQCGKVKHGYSSDPVISLVTSPHDNKVFFLLHKREHFE